MNIKHLLSNDNAHKSQNTGKKLGTIAGFAGYTANVAIKEGKDVFKNSIQIAEAQGLGKNVGIAVKVGSIALVSSAFAIAGRIIGGTIGKIVDKHRAKKQEKILGEFEAVLNAYAAKNPEQILGSKCPVMQDAAFAERAIKGGQQRGCVARH